MSGLTPIEAELEHPEIGRFRVRASVFVAKSGKTYLSPGITFLTLPPGSHQLTEEHEVWIRGELEALWRAR